VKELPDDTDVACPPKLDLFPAVSELGISPEQLGIINVSLAWDRETLLVARFHLVRTRSFDGWVGRAHP